MRIVTKATDIQFIDEKCLRKKRKSRKIALSGLYILQVFHATYY